MFWTASSGRSKLERCKNQLSGAAESRIVEDQTIMKRLQRRDDDDDDHDHDHDGVMKKNNFCTRHVRDPCRSFGRRCSLLVKEQRARFYILRRCITMLLCWHERGDP